MRAIAILAVVFGHSFWFLSRIDSLPVFGNVLKYLIHYSRFGGVFGVELFFVLSGFLIGKIIIRSFVDASRFSLSDLKNFWVRRWFRTLPDYWLLLTVCFLLFKWLKPEVPELNPWQDYFFLQNLWYPYVNNVFNEGWSLAVEEWFYLTLPVTIYLCSLIFPHTNKPKFLIRVFIGYMAFFILLRAFNAIHPINGADSDEGIRKVVVFRLDAVMYGVIFAWLNEYKKEFLTRIKNYLFGISVVASVVIYYLATKYQLFYYARSPIGMYLRDAFFYFIIPVFLSLCLPFASGIKTIGNTGLARVIQFISKISYSMYLVHYTLIFLAFYRDAKVASPYEVMALYVLYWVVVIGLSALIYKYFEYPIMQLRDRISPRG